MAVKALNKADCEWWSNKIETAYVSFKDRVKKAIEPMDIDEESKRRYYEKIAREEIKKRPFCMYGDGNAYEYVRINEGYGDVDIMFSIRYNDEHPKYTDAKRDKYMEQRCHQIREICEPYQKERDNLLVLIHSRPTQEDLAGIVAWCNKLEGLYVNKKECEL